MLSGRVNSEREALLDLEIHGDDKMVRLSAVIDTGYDGFLTLPRLIIEELDLPYLGPAQAVLGDGNATRLDVYVARVHWHDAERDVLVLEAEGGVLVGMAMLSGSRLAMDVEHEGAVSIRSLAEIRALN